MSKKKVGIIGGSKIDTEIGVRFFTSKGLHTKGYPVAPEAKQYELLLRNAPKIKSRVIEIIRKITNEGLNSVIIYCNSLSSIINAENIAANEKIRIMTPLSTYKEVANKYEKIGVIAGNNQGLAGIEKVILEANSNCKVVGLGMLHLVMDIEKGLPAKTIIEKHKLKTFFEFLEANAIEKVILGCTHYSYLYHDLKEITSIQVFDPSEFMSQLI